MDSRSAGCPGSGQLAAFLDDTLEERDRRTIRDHLVSCKECSAVIAEAVRSRNQSRGRFPGRWFRGSRALWLTGFLIVIGAVLFLVLSPGRRLAPHPPGEVMRGLGPLLSAMGESRPIEGRVSGRVPWKALAPFERSSGARATPSWEILAEAARIEKQADASPTAENLHALGIAHLLLGDLEDAVARLREALRRAPDQPRIACDLGAALLERGRREEKPEDLVESLSWIDKGLSAGERFPEAVFNRALVIEKLHLNEIAIEAWEQYLSGGDEPGWAEEARQRLESLRGAPGAEAWAAGRQQLEEAAGQKDADRMREIVTRWPQESREWLAVEVLGSWARAVLDGQPNQAELRLELAEAVASARTVVGADPGEASSVRILREASSSRQRTQVLSQGQVAYTQGRRFLDQYRLDDAQAALERARDALAGTPQAGWATYELARCAYYQERLEDAARLLDPLVARSEQAGDRALAGHARRLRGVIGVVRARFDEALQDCRLALAHFESLREEENQAAVWNVLADYHSQLGDDRQALRAILQAVARIPVVQDPGRSVVFLIHAALLVAREGFPDVAYLFHDLAVTVAERNGDAIDAADSLQRRGRLATTLGRIASAQADMAEARRRTATISDRDLRSRLLAEISLGEAGLARAGGDPGRGAERATEAVAFFSGAGRETRLPEAYLERGRSLLARGDAAAAENDFLEGIHCFERHRGDIAAAGSRISYFDTAAGLFDELVGLRASSGEPDRALMYLEWGKTREFDAAWQVPPGTDVAALAARIPPGISVIVYGVLEDRLLVWTIARDGEEFTTHPIRAGELGEQVRAFREEIESPASDAAPEAAGTVLQRTILGETAARLADARVLVFVPDKSLHAVPFAALRDPSTGRRLIEEHCVIVAPSVSVFLHAIESRSGAQVPARLGLLAVGDPAFDSVSYPGLSRLTAAAEETRRIARIYARPEVLNGEAATKRAVLGSIGEAEVVHLAAHALENESDPMRARLILAPDPEGQDNGALLAEDIYRIPLPKTRLVVLAACATGSGRISRGEGPLSLARPFLHAGVPAVLATLWPIADAPSAEILLTFHRAIASGRPPEEALRDAQLAAIASPDPALRSPRVWAAFQLVGGTTSVSTRTRKEG